MTTIESLKFFTGLAGVAIKYDLQIVSSLQASYERPTAARKKNTDSGAAKKGPKNLLTAAASVQSFTA